MIKCHITPIIQQWCWIFTQVLVNLVWDCYTVHFHSDMKDNYTKSHCTKKNKNLFCSVAKILDKTAVVLSYTAASGSLQSAQSRAKADCWRDVGVFVFCLFGVFFVVFWLTHWPMCNLNHNCSHTIARVKWQMTK